MSTSLGDVDGVDDVDVVVVVGTDHHAFDRLVGWVDRWAAERGMGERCLVQFGTSAPPRHVRSVAYLQRDQVLALFATVRAVVCHGGPSTIVEALRAGRMPIVLPRAPELDEHVDEHQQRFARALAAKGAISLVTDEATLADHLDRELAGPSPVNIDLPPAAEAARAVGDVVAQLTRPGPSRRLRLLRWAAERKP